jgi:hypothetical protein
MSKSKVPFDDDDDLDALFGSGPPTASVVGISLQAARDDLRAKSDKGARCPCCNKWVKKYDRPLNHTMVACLYWLVARFEAQGSKGWIDVPAEGPLWLQKSKQHTILAWWGLVERAPNTGDPTKKHLGLWRPTFLGIQAARGQVTVPKSVCTLNGEVLWVSPKQVRVADVRGVTFSYQDTMKPVFRPPTKPAKSAPVLKVVPKEPSVLDLFDDG